MTLFILMAAPFLVLPASHWSTNSTFWKFDVYTGPNTNTYTNRIDVGFPRTGITNFESHVKVPDGKNAYVVTVTDKQSGLESDYSNSLTHTNGTNVWLAWWWIIPPPTNAPTTNIVTIASGTNSLSLTNPWSKSQVYRLKNKTLQFALDPLGPWLNLTNWPGASNKLAISLTR